MDDVSSRRAASGWLFATVSVAAGLLLALAGLEAVLRVLPVRESSRPLAVNATNPVLRFTPNRDFLWSRGWNFARKVRKHANNFGFLSDVDYDRSAAAPLVALVGDSYVEAMQVRAADAVGGMLGRQLGERARVYSLAASGAPLSTYLAYADYARQNFAPRAMVFVVVGNDFDESLFEYKSAPGLTYFRRNDTRPGGFDLVRVDTPHAPVRNLVKELALVRYLYYNVQVEAILERGSAFEPASGAAYVGNTSADASPARLRDSRAVIDEFLQRLPVQAGLPPGRVLFVLDAIRPEMYDDAALARAGDSYFARMREYFAATAGKQGYAVLDLQPLFRADYRAQRRRFEFEDDMHWNEYGHALVARSIAGSAWLSGVLASPAAASSSALR